MFNILQNTGFKFKERKVIYNLYMKDAVEVRIGNKEEEPKIVKYIRQRFSLSAIIVYLYTEETIN